jgi:hypothetical protein
LAAVIARSPLLAEIYFRHIFSSEMPIMKAAPILSAGPAMSHEIPEVLVWNIL